MAFDVYDISAHIGKHSGAEWPREYMRKVENF
jgi:hypothetical protein